MRSIDQIVLSVLATAPAAIVQAEEYRIRLDDINLNGQAAWKAWLRNEYGGKVFAVNSAAGAAAILSARNEFVNAGLDAEDALASESGTMEERYQRFLVTHQRMQQAFAKLRQTVAAYGRRVQ